MVTMAINGSGAHAWGHKRTFEPLADDITNYSFKRRRILQPAHPSRPSHLSSSGAPTRLAPKRHRGLEQLAWPASKRIKQDLSSNAIDSVVATDPQPLPPTSTALIQYQPPTYMPCLDAAAPTAALPVPHQKAPLLHPGMTDHSLAPQDTQLVVWKEPAELYGFKRI